MHLSVWNGTVLKWLRGLIRNQLPSGARVRITSVSWSSFFFYLVHQTKNILKGDFFFLEKEKSNKAKGKEKTYVLTTFCCCWIFSRSSFRTMSCWWAFWRICCNLSYSVKSCRTVSCNIFSIRFVSSNFESSCEDRSFILFSNEAVFWESAESCVSTSTWIVWTWLCFKGNDCWWLDKRISRSDCVNRSRSCSEAEYWIFKVPMEVNTHIRKEAGVKLLCGVLLEFNIFFCRWMRSAYLLLIDYGASWLPFQELVVDNLILKSHFRAVRESNQEKNDQH